MTRPAIPVRSKLYTLAPYYVAGYQPRVMPLAPAFTASHVSAGTHATTDPRSAQLGVDLGSYARWIADPATMIDDGMGFLRWHPSQGSCDHAANYWLFQAAHAPPHDPDYSWKLRDGTVVSIPAYLFLGDMWGQLQGAADHSGFTAIIVARLRGSNGGSYANIFASAYGGGDPDVHTNIALRLRGDTITTAIDAVNGTDDVDATGRPQLVATAQADTSSTQYVMDSNTSRKHFNHPSAGGYDMHWFLGREGGVYLAPRTILMDVVDIVLWLNTQTDAQLRASMAKLNGVYGILG